MAWWRARSSAPAGTAASTSAVTSVLLCGRVIFVPLPGSSSARVAARKPFSIRLRSGVECCCRMSNAQWWLVMTSPSAVRKPPEQPPPTRTAAARRPAPSRLHSASGGISSPSRRSSWGSMSRICWGVHFPSTAWASPAASAQSRAAMSGRLVFFMAGVVYPRVPAMRRALRRAGGGRAQRPRAAARWVGSRSPPGRWPARSERRPGS